MSRPSRIVPTRLFEDPNDSRVLPDVSVDGAPPLIRGGDRATKLVAVSCGASADKKPRTGCSERIGELWLTESTAHGTGAVWSLVSRVIADPQARPVTMQFVEQLVTPGEKNLVTHCPTHGSRQVPAEQLLRRGRKSLGRSPGERLARFVARDSASA